MTKPSESLEAAIGVMLFAIMCFALGVGTCRIVRGASPPPHLAVVFDASGSMSGEKWQKGLAAALDNVIQAPLEDARLKVWSFETNPHVWPYGWRTLPSAKSSKLAIAWLEQEGVGDMTYPGPALASALAEDVHPLAIAIVTDGKLSRSVASVNSYVIAGQAKRPPNRKATVSIFIIGDNPDEEKALKRLAKNNGGSYIECR